MINQSKKIKVLHVLCSLNVGGVQTNLITLIKNTNQDVFDIHVVYSGEDELKREFEAAGAQLFKLQNRSLRFRDWGIFFSIINLIKFIKKQEIQLIHTHLFVPYFVGTVAAIFTKIPIVNHIHTEEFRSHKNNSALTSRVCSEHPILNRLLIYRTNLTIALNRDTQNAITNLGIRQSCVPVIYNGITPVDLPNNEILKKIRFELNINDSEKIVVSVARLTLQKDPAFLINVIPRVLKRYPKTKFFWVGDGPLKQEIEELIVSLDLEENVFLLGLRKDIFPILAVSDIFVLPSVWEQHPITVLEAMLMKKPVIATRVGGVPETVEDGVSGVLISPRDADQLENALLKLIADDFQRATMGLEGRRIVLEKFSALEAAKTIENYYLNLLES